MCQVVSSWPCVELTCVELTCRVDHVSSWLQLHSTAGFSGHTKSRQDAVMNQSPCKSCTVVRMVKEDTKSQRTPSWTMVMTSGWWKKTPRATGRHHGPWWWHQDAVMKQSSCILPIWCCQRPSGFCWEQHDAVSSSEDTVRTPSWSVHLSTVVNGFYYDRDSLDCCVQLPGAVCLTNTEPRLHHSLCTQAELNIVKCYFYLVTLEVIWQNQWKNCSFIRIFNKLPGYDIVYDHIIVRRIWPICGFCAFGQMCSSFDQMRNVW